MSFTQPIFLWGFLGLVPLVAVYLLRVQPIRKRTTAYFLWEEIFQQNRAQKLFQRFRDLLSLLIMIAVFSFLVLAMAGARWTVQSQKNLVLLIDNSASMNSKHNGSTRLEDAKKIAMDIVTALDGNQRCSIVSVANQAVFHSNLTENPQELIEAIRRIEVHPVPFRESLLSQFAPQTEAADSKDRPTDQVRDVSFDSLADTPHRLILISDGCFAQAIPDKIELLKIKDDATENMGIVACDFQRVPGGVNRVGVFFQIASSYSEAVDVDVEVQLRRKRAPAADSADGSSISQLVKLIPLTVQPGLNEPEIFYLENAQAGEWTLRIDHEDDLEFDNFAYAAVLPPRPIPVKVVATDRYFFENSVEAFSRDGGILSLRKDNPQLTIVQGNPADGTMASVETDAIIFHPQGDSKWWTSLGDEIEVSVPRVLDENHPVLRHLDATTIPFVGARILQAPPGADVWVVAEDDTPLIYRVTRAGQSVVVVNHDPLQSDFYLSAWFPVLVYSAATNLSGRDESLQSSYPTGQFANIPAKATNSSTKVTTPVGDEFETSQQLVGPLDQNGFYELENETGSWLLGCGLYSQNETLNNGNGFEDTSEPIPRGTSATGWLTMLAIGLVTLESFLYHRRKVG